MLQWMGGSRRKVTTSRKSIQKRQKQYFEQRRRQQHQQTAGLESSEGGGNKWEQNRKDHLSLDILNLLNFSTSSQHCRPNCPSEREDPKVASTVKYCITADPPIIQTNAVTPTESLEIKKASCQVETLSPKKVQFVSQDNQNNTFNRNDNKPDIWKTATQQQLSFFDLVGDDESNGNLLRSPTHEAHVAFSVDGLGKVGTKTPVHSPLQPDRYVSYGCSSPSKAARQLNSSRNLYSALNDLELQVDAIMQDIEMPQSGSSSEFSTGIKDSYSKVEKNLHTVRDHMQLDGQGSKVRSSYCDGKLFCSTGNDTEVLWHARYSLLDAPFPDEKLCDMSWKSWPCNPDDGSANFLNYVDDEMPNYAFGGPRLAKKRGVGRAKERFNFLESDLPAPKHRTSENDYDFAIFKGTSGNHHLAGTNFDFGDVTGHLDWSCFTKEDARESTSLLSEESCSATAVKGEVSNISAANSRARVGRRHQSDFGSPEIKHGAKNILAKEKHFKNKADLQKRNNVCWPGKSTQISTLSESESIHNLNYLSQEKIGPQGSWLFEDGYRSADMNLGLSSLCGTSEIKHPFSGSMPFVEDIFDIFPVPESHSDAKFSFSRSKHSSAFKSSTSGSCISKKFSQPFSDKHSHDSPSTKVDFWATKPDFSPDSPDFELESRPLHSSQDDVSHGEKLISELSGQGSVSKDEETKSESEHATCDNIKPQKEILVGKNLKVVEDSVENSSEWKELKDRKLKTSSYAKISDKSESSVDGKAHHHGDEVPLLCKNRKKEIANEGPGERKNGGERLSNCLNSSPQLMMLESFVLQLLCVQKVPNEVSGQFP